MDALAAALSRAAATGLLPPRRAHPPRDLGGPRLRPLSSMHPSNARGTSNGPSPPPTSTTAGADGKRTGTSPSSASRRAGSGSPFCSAPETRAGPARAPPRRRQGAGAAVRRSEGRDGGGGAGRIATAHHADDRLKTHLIAQERRGGPSSLAGPRERREDGLVRPFLDVSRTEIAAYLAARNIPGAATRPTGICVWREIASAARS